MPTKRLIVICIVSFLMSFCAKLGRGPTSMILDDDVASREGQIIDVEGFTISGGYSYRSAEAIGRSTAACSSFTSAYAELFDRFRFVNLWDDRFCNQPENETPFGRGFLYVYRPTVKYLVDPEDVGVVVDGPIIEGEEAQGGSLGSAYSSLERECLAALREAKEQMGSALIIGSCGEAESHVRMVYSEDHGFDIPYLKLTSQVKLYMRQGVERSRTTSYPMSSRAMVELPDVAQALLPIGSAGREVVISTFAGSLTKVNLESGLKVWEQNLTNPEPDSVRQTTGLYALAVAEDAQSVAVGGSYGYLAIVNGNTGQKEKILSCHPQMFAPKHFEALRFSRDRRELLSVARLAQYPEGSTGYNQMVFRSGFNDHIVTSRHVLESWATETETVRWSTELTSGYVMEVGYSADEDLVFVVATDRVAIFSAQTGELLREYMLAHYEGDLRGAMITGASFSSDMRILAMSGYSGVMLIDTQTESLVTRLRASLTYELGRPEIVAGGNKVRAFDAYGSVYQWDRLSGVLESIGTAGYSLNYNGPRQMPILSTHSGEYLVQTASYSGGGIQVQIDRHEPAETLERLCLAGEDSSLPPLTIRSGGRLMLWSEEENDDD